MARILGRTVPKHVRVYMDGYDMSGYSRTIGPLKHEYEEADLTVQMSDDVMGALPNLPSISVGTLNGVFDNTATSGLHALASPVPTSRIMTIPIGIQAAPQNGDTCFNGQFVQLGYEGEPVGPSVYANVPFGEWDVANELNYDQAWGKMVHVKAARTAPNTANNDVDGGAATSKGGYLVYHIFAGAGGDGTATISIDDSADNSSWLALSGATAGELDCRTVQKGIVQLAVGATVRQYLRWQLSLNGATTVTFAIAFVRGK